MVLAVLAAPMNQKFRQICMCEGGFCYVDLSDGGDREAVIPTLRLKGYFSSLKHEVSRAKSGYVIVGYWKP
jgi:hypothetical protein